MPELSKQRTYDVIVLGGGAAGLMAAATAGKRGRRVLLVEASNKLGKKILMSGGGRCNFTNLDVLPQHFLCSNPHFVKSALSQYSNWDFIGMVAAYGIDYHEKDHGQLFCDHSAKEILAMLQQECEEVSVEFLLKAQVDKVSSQAAYQVSTSQGLFCAASLIVATGGLSIPSLGGATGLGYDLARQFGLAVNPLSASLVPFTLSGRWHEFVVPLSGVSLPVSVAVPSKRFEESMLFTHRGLSGPAILQLSNYWTLGESIEINLLPHDKLHELLVEKKQANPNAQLQSVLSGLLPKSLLASVQEQWWPELRGKPLQEISNQRLLEIAEHLHRWRLTPSGTEGYRTAEVTHGGVDVSAISSKTMQVQGHEGLFFIGEVLDVTGHLGGFNFQWAWSSGYVAGMNA